MLYLVSNLSGCRLVLAIRYCAQFGASGDEGRIPSWRAAQLARNKEKVHNRLQRAQLSGSDSPKVARAQTKLVVQLSHKSDIENLVDSLAVDSP